MTNNDLVKRVEAYLERGHKGKVELFPITKRGTFQAYCGAKSEWGEHAPVAIYTGAFINAVAALVQRNDYAGFYASPTNPDSANGFLQLYHPPEITQPQPVPGLVDIIRAKEQYEKRLAKLEENK